ncbi:membrane-spanning 4-domains subfamily A member 18-like [Garra rufa]|uniref:membrane-spanning 4-domains subfamily A member 18-like n=1 Tax=Garra rufa TaxID=137080 RepID=UPI003CCEE9EE
METSKVISTDKATVVIEINPQEAKDSAIFVDGQEAGGPYHNINLKGFFKIQPMALGTVQIMIGVMVFLLGILQTTTNDIYLYRYSAIVVYSGITYWGSLIYISAGSLSVAAHKKLHSCVVKASLGMNVVSAITAGISIILMGIQLRVISVQPMLNAEELRIIGVILVFIIPQFIISICISEFACKATCNIQSTVVNVLLN